MTRFFFPCLTSMGMGTGRGGVCTRGGKVLDGGGGWCPFRGDRKTRAEKKTEETRCGERAVKLPFSLGKRGQLHQQLVELIICNLLLFPQAGNDRLGLLRLGSAGVRTPTAAARGSSPTARGVARQFAGVHHHTHSVQRHHQATRGKSRRPAATPSARPQPSETRRGAQRAANKAGNDQRVTSPQPVASTSAHPPTGRRQARGRPHGQHGQQGTETSPQVSYAGHRRDAFRRAAPGCQARRPLATRPPRVARQARRSSRPPQSPPTPLPPPRRLPPLTSVRTPPPPPLLSSPVNVRLQA